MKHNEHPVLSDKNAILIWLLLCVGTVITVAAAAVDLGPLNVPIALLIATIKASLVVIFFMGMRHETGELRVMAGSSFVFVGIFIILTGSDIFFRQNPWVVGPIFKEASASSTQVASPWNKTDELIALGKENYATQCMACHGASGKGDGPAAAAMNPKPRNFHSDQGWLKERRPSLVFETLSKGVGKGMPAFSTLSSDIRWGLAHYLLSFGPEPKVDSEADLKKIGIDPNQKGGSTSEKVLPIDFAIERVARDS